MFPLLHSYQACTTYTSVPDQRLLVHGMIWRDIFKTHRSIFWNTHGCIWGVRCIASPILWWKNYTASRWPPRQLWCRYYHIDILMILTEEKPQHPLRSTDINLWWYVSGQGYWQGRVGVTICGRNFRTNTSYTIEPWDNEWVLQEQDQSLPLFHLNLFYHPLHSISWNIFNKFLRQRKTSRSWEKIWMSLC